MNKILMTTALAVTLCFAPKAYSDVTDKELFSLEDNLKSYAQFVEKKLMNYRNVLEILQHKKGHDKALYEKMLKVQEKIDHAEEMLKKIQDVKPFPVQLRIELGDISGDLKKIRKTPVRAGTEFPMACATLKAGENIVEKQGIVDKLANAWNLILVENGETRRIQIAENAGLIGSSSSTAPELVRSRTPQNHYVKALVDEKLNGEKGSVRCLSQPIKAPKLERLSAVDN